MKTRCKRLRLICTSVKIDDVKNDGTIEDIQPFCPGLPEEQKREVAVANFKWNTPKDQFGDSLATGLITVWKKVRCSLTSLNNYQFTQDPSIVTPKNGRLSQGDSIPLAMLNVSVLNIFQRITNENFL